MPSPVGLDARKTGKGPVAQLDPWITVPLNTQLAGMVSVYAVMFRIGSVMVTVFVPPEAYETGT
jgi:hypothetical protein